MPIINSSYFGSGGTDISDATAAASQILAPYTAYVASGKVTGTMPSQGAQTITPGTTNQTIQSGRYLSGTQTILGDAQLIPENIKDGVNIFGVTGVYGLEYYNYTNGATFSYENNQIIIPGTWSYLFGVVGLDGGGISLFHYPNASGYLVSPLSTATGILTKSTGSNQTILTSHRSFSELFPSGIDSVSAYVL